MNCKTPGGLSRRRELSSVFCRSAAKASTARLCVVAPPLQVHLDVVRRFAHRYFNSPWSASSSTAARSRTNGEIAPSLTAFATVTGLVRNSQTVATASTTAIDGNRTEHADAEALQAHHTSSTILPN